MIAGRRHIGRYCTFMLSMFSLIRRLPHVKRSLIGQLYDHAANMNSESHPQPIKLIIIKKCPKLQTIYSKRLGKLKTPQSDHKPLVTFSHAPRGIQTGKYI